MPLKLVQQWQFLVFEIKYLAFTAVFDIILQSEITNFNNLLNENSLILFFV